MLKFEEPPSSRCVHSMIGTLYLTGTTGVEMGCLLKSIPVIEVCKFSTVKLSIKVFSSVKYIRGIKQFFSWKDDVINYY